MLQLLCTFVRDLIMHHIPSTQIFNDLYETFNTDDKLCKKYLSIDPHYVYVSDDNYSNVIFIIACVDSDDKLSGCMIDKNDTYEFFTDNYIKRKSTKITKITKKILQNTIIPRKLKFIPTNLNLQTELIDFCKKFSFNTEKLSISIVYIKSEQSDTDTIFSNDYKNSSNDYKNFLRSLRIPDTFDEENMFDDIFDDYMKVRWYPSTHMNKDQIRQYIGNTHCVILFYDNHLLPQSTIFNIFGKVNQVFICVTRDKLRDKLCDDIRYNSRSLSKKLCYNSSDGSLGSESSSLKNLCHNSCDNELNSGSLMCDSNIPQILNKSLDVVTCCTNNTINIDNLNRNYKVRIVRKYTICSHSLPDYNLIYNHDNIYDGILKQVKINTINIKKKSHLSQLYTYPREISLINIKLLCK
jgi:hypothetical protein